MRLERVDVLTYGGGVTRVRSASEQWAARTGRLLRLVTNDGRIGQGEASPLPRYSTDTIAEAERALAQVRWSAVPEFERGEIPEGYLARVSETLGALPPSAAFAVETALLDLVGQQLGTPIWALLDGTERAPVPLSALIGNADDATAPSRAATAAARGIHTVKVKIQGPSLGDQQRTLALIRDALGARHLRLDANRTFAAESVRKELDALGSLEPELVEEPTDLGALAGMEALGFPLALDESLQEPGAFERLEPHLGRLGCVALVLKPMALGGFLACLRLARRAAANGLDVTVSHLFDGPVALAAAAHLGLAAGSRSRASGLDRHGGLAAWPNVAVAHIGATTLVAASQPGLGVTALPEPG